MIFTRTTPGSAANRITKAPSTINTLVGFSEKIFLTAVP
jgi:hypothetical protein